MIAPSPTYDYTNEAQFRSQLEQDQLRSVRTDRAVQSILLTGDDGITYRIEMIGGVLTPTALP